MTDEEKIICITRAICKSQNVDYDEVCGFETESEECNSGSCVAAHFEDHDPDHARTVYRRMGKAAFEAMKTLNEETKQKLLDQAPQILEQFKREYPT